LEKLRRIDQLQRRNVLAINKSVDFHANKAKKLASSRVLAEPTSWLADREILVVNYLQRVVAAFHNTVRICEHRYALLTTRLDANSPLKIMSKGYCLVQKADGSLVKTVNKVSLGEEVEISVSDGSIVACVKSLKRR
ncbi:MAG: exodeoxyribonuclease VII large subunit, partial [Acidaminococcaceae bacterium]|nr:exodeoxyribonuclease VII large subunit [Acidaminococcaceae bacterium]